VASLLRGLPDPEPPGDLVEAVMAKVAEREARPRVLRRIFGSPAGAAVGTALAAGIAGLLVLGAFGDALLPPVAPEIAASEPLKPTRAQIVARGTGANATAIHSQQRVTPAFPSAAVVDPQAVAFLERPSQPPFAAGRATAGAPRVASPLDRRLDLQLNQLLLDPAAFYQRLDQVRDSEQFVARLADRAARRGDAVEVALRLRQQLPEREQMAEMVERLLWAAALSSKASRP
jgi:hypothetical protein